MGRNTDKCDVRLQSSDALTPHCEIKFDGKTGAARLLSYDQKHTVSVNGKVVLKTMRDGVPLKTDDRINILTRNFRFQNFMVYLSRQ